MRNFFLIILYCTISLELFSKDSNDKYKAGFELNSYVLFKGYMANIPKGINLFASINKHELYGGTDIYRILNSTKIFGAQIGYKYHFPREKKLSHFYLDLSNQFSRWSFGNRYSLNYNYQPQYEGDAGNLCRIWSVSSSLLIGYEKYIIKRFSVIISAGPGIIYYHQEPNPLTSYAPYSYCTISTGFLPIINVKTGMRIYIVRREK